MNVPLNDHLIQRTVLVFTKTRHRATKICKILNGANIRAGEIHSDISQNKRESTLKQFRDGRISVLVATDIAARGLDVPSISHVVNYDLPLFCRRLRASHRPYRKSWPFWHSALVCQHDQRYLVRDIEKVTGRSLNPDSPFSASRNDSKGARASRNRQSSGRNGGRNSNGRHGGSGSDARRDRPQSEGRGRPASEARHFGEKQRGEFDATRTQRSEQTPANEGFRRSEQSQAKEGSHSFASKAQRTSEVTETFTSNRAKKYLPQSNFWTPRDERSEQTSTNAGARTDRSERVIVGSGLSAERPKPRFDRFKKKRAEGSSSYDRSEGTSERGERKGQYGSRKPAGYKPAKSRGGQDKGFEFRDSAKRTSSIINKRTRNGK